MMVAIINQPTFFSSVPWEKNLFSLDIFFSF